MMYRPTCGFGMPTVYDVIKEDWFNTDLPASAIAKKHGLRLKTVREVIRLNRWPQRNPNRSASLRLFYQRKKGEI